jgi:hypothetical protein
MENKHWFRIYKSPRPAYTFYGTAPAVEYEDIDADNVIESDRGSLSFYKNHKLVVICAYGTWSEVRRVWEIVE